MPVDDACPSPVWTGGRDCGVSTQTLCTRAFSSATWLSASRKLSIPLCALAYLSVKWV